jgi:protein gp37
VVVEEVAVAEEVEEEEEVVVNMVLHQYKFQHSCNNHRHSIHTKRTHRIRKVVGEAEVAEEVLHTQGMDR